MIYGRGQVHVQNVETDLVTNGIFGSPVFTLNDLRKMHLKMFKKKKALADLQCCYDNTLMMQ